MIDAALLRAIGSDGPLGGPLNGAAKNASAERREACACALAAMKAGEALMDADGFARMLSLLDAQAPTALPGPAKR